MNNVAFTCAPRRLALTVGILLTSPVALGQSNLESPGQNALVSGISLVSGWKCTAGELTFTVDGGTAFPLSYGTPAPTCFPRVPARA